MNTSSKPPQGRLRGPDLRSPAKRVGRPIETWHPPMLTASSGAVVVVVTEDERSGAAVQRAAALAETRAEPLILYDWDAPSLLAEPLPTWWSSDGAAEMTPDRLDDEQLEAAGRPTIADQVRRARSGEVEAFGWLPSDHGAGALVDYATAQRASIVVIPRDLAELDGFAALINGTAHPADEVRERASAAVVIV